MSDSLLWPREEHTLLRKKYGDRQAQSVFIIAAVVAQHNRAETACDWTVISDNEN